jgi:small subunit ribosomal protein S25
MDRKLSTSIFQELMDTAGGSSWERWKAGRIFAGLPIISQAVVEIPKVELERQKTGAAAVLP